MKNDEQGQKGRTHHPQTKNKLWKQIFIFARKENSLGIGEESHLITITSNSQEEDITRFKLLTSNQRVLSRLSFTITNMTTNEKIKTGRHFKIDEWPRIKHAALALALQEIQPCRECWDQKKINKILNRWKIREAFAFYSRQPEDFFN